MSKTITTFLAVLLCAIIIPSAAQNTRSISGVFDYGRARQVVSKINQYRQNKGLSFLRMKTALTDAAMIRAAELAFQTEILGKDVLSYELENRPNGETDLKLINEQYHNSVTITNNEHIYLIREQLPITNSVMDVIRYNHKDVLYNSNCQAIGCGTFISSEGHFYWVIFLILEGEGEMNVPTGQWNAQVKIGLQKEAKLKELEASLKTNPNDENKTAFEKQNELVNQKKAEIDLTPTSYEVKNQFDYQKAIEVVECTNKERIARGLEPYIMDSTLTELAMIRAAEMRGSHLLTHYRPKGGTGTSIISSPCSQMGENIGHGHKTAKDVVAHWMTSPGHRGNILNTFQYIGVGECDSYWVQLFLQSNEHHVIPVEESSGHIDEVTVKVSLSPEVESEVIKRERIK